VSGYLSEEETYLVDMMSHDLRGTVILGGKATYQIDKLEACLKQLPVERMMDPS
jgi:hypothetical protein